MIQIKKVNCFSRAGWRQAVVCVRCLCLCFWLMSVAVGCQDNGGATIITGANTTWEAMTDEAKSFGGEDDFSEGSQNGQAELESVTTSTIYVHVCGQVTVPGVYVLPEGSRVWDAVEAAGGFLPEAAEEAVNLAMMVADGSKVTIPDPQQAGEGGFRWYETGSGVLTIGGDIVGKNSNNSPGVDDATGLIDINRADVAALMTIPGIGQTRAEAIVSYRETRGPFGTIEEIMEVAGIKEGLFARIREYITVGG